MPNRPTPDDPIPDAYIRRVVHDWHRGILGPGFMWSLIYDTLLRHGGFAAGMNACDPETQAAVRQVFADLPWTSFWTETHPAEPPDRKEIREWCERRT